MRRALVFAAMLTLGFVAARTVRGWFPVRVEGESMSPTIVPGDLLAVRPPRPGEQLRGSIVVVRRGAIEVVKRVVAPPLDVALAPGDVWLEGDALERSTDSRMTGPVQLRDVAGVVVARYWPPARARLFVR